MKEFIARLSRLRVRARDDLNNRGINTLYLAFGLLQWREAEHSEEEIYSPLILVPVILSRKGLLGSFQLRRLPEEEITINPTLREKLSHDFGIQLPKFDELLQNDDPELEDRAESAKQTLATMLHQLKAMLPRQLPWQILPEVHLGRFFFQKLVMYQDLEHHRDELLGHPLLQVLGGERILPVNPADAITAATLDLQVQPETMLEILDADSSQQEAIVAAKRGVSFVLQGPPGTGKSQTIANIIAEVLGLGRSVLFVSEKMAALEVVRQRLRDAGLGDFCLDLHDPRADKKLFIRDLDRALHDAATQQPVRDDRSWHQQAAALKQAREELNRYVHELHQPRFSLQLSAFQAHGELAKLESVPHSSFALAHVEAITDAQFGQMKQALQALCAYADVLDQYDTFPWHETLIKTSSLERQSDIRAHFGRLAHRLQQCNSELMQLGVTLGEDDAELTWAWAKKALDRARFVLGSPLCPPRHWLRHDALPELRAIISAASARSTSYAADATKIQSKYAESVLALDHRTVLHALTDTAAHIMGCMRPLGWLPQDISIRHRQEIDEHLHRARATLVQLVTAATSLAKHCGQQPPKTLGAIRALAVCRREAVPPSEMVYC